jgi:hypothetical protein
LCAGGAAKAASRSMPQAANNATRLAAMRASSAFLPPKACASSTIRCIRISRPDMGESLAGPKRAGRKSSENFRLLEKKYKKIRFLPGFCFGVRFLFVHRLSACRYKKIFLFQKRKHVS